MKVQSLPNYSFKVLSSTSSNDGNKIIQTYRNLPDEYKDLLNRLRSLYQHSPQPMKSLEDYVKNSSLSFDNDPAPVDYLIELGLLCEAPYNRFEGSRYMIPPPLSVFLSTAKNRKI